MYEGDGFAARGTLVTEEMADDEGFYNITSITGERNGIKIVELTEVGVPIPGNEPFVVDNAIRAANDAAPGQLTSDGIGILLEDGVFLNPYYASWLDPPAYFEIYSAEPFDDGISGPEDHELLINFTAAIVPDIVTSETYDESPSLASTMMLHVVPVLVNAAMLSMILF